MKEEDMKSECPHCHNEPKVLKRCHCCKEWCCNLCSIELVCKDCFNWLNKKAEREKYYNDKYAMFT